MNDFTKGLKRHETINRLEQEKKWHIGQKMKQAISGLNGARSGLVQSYAFVSDEDRPFVVDLLDQISILDSTIQEHFKSCIQAYNLHGSSDE